MGDYAALVARLRGAQEHHDAYGQGISDICAAAADAIETQAAEIVRLREALCGLIDSASLVADSLTTHELGSMDIRRYRRWEEADATARMAALGIGETKP